MGSKVILLAMMASLFPGESHLALAAGAPSSGTLGGALGGSKQQVEGAQEMSCQSPQYKSPDQKQACMSCKETVSQWKEKVPKLVDQASQKDSMTSGLFGASSGAAVGSLGGAQSEDMGTHSGVTGSAKDAMKARGNNASQAQGEFKKCLQDIEQKCQSVNLASEDKATADKVTQACREGEQKAGDFANKQNQGGDGMGDLSKLAQAAQQAMQAAQQQAQKKESQQPELPNDPQSQISSLPETTSQDATSPTPDQGDDFSLSDPQEVAGAKLDGAGSGASFVGLSPTADLGKSVGGQPLFTPGFAGVGGARDAYSSASRPFDVGNLASDGSASLDAGGAGTSGGTAGGGGGSSGASRAAEAAVAAAAAASEGASGENANGYEMSYGGGGRASMGLKPGKGDLAELDGGGSLGEGGSANFGDDGGDRGPASEMAGDNDALATDADSIFLRVRQKYGLLKGAGRI